MGIVLKKPACGVRKYNNIKKEDFCMFWMLDHKKYGFKKLIFGYLIVMLLSLVVSVCSILTFTGVIGPRFRGMTSVFVFSIIPILYTGVYIFVLIKTRKYYDKLPEKNKFMIDVSKQTLMYISILLIIFFLFLTSLRFPFQKQGVNDIPLSLTVQPYLANDTLELYNVTALSKVNNIYRNYNLTINLEPQVNLNFSFNDSDKALIFGQNCTYIDELYRQVNNSNNNVKLIIINSNNSIDGMGHFCGKSDLIIMSANSKEQGWVLAHELGHILSAKKECWKYNLMKEYSNECFNGANWFVHNYIRDLRPAYLTQEQVDSIVQSVKNRF